MPVCKLQLRCNSTTQAAVAPQSDCSEPPQALTTGPLRLADPSQASKGTTKHSLAPFHNPHRLSRGRRIHAWPPKELNLAGADKSVQASQRPTNQRLDPVQNPHMPRAGADKSTSGPFHTVHRAQATQGPTNPRLGPFQTTQSGCCTANRLLHRKQAAFALQPGCCCRAAALLHRKQTVAPHPRAHLLAKDQIRRNFTGFNLVMVGQFTKLPLPLQTHSRRPRKILFKLMFCRLTDSFCNLYSEANRSKLS